MDEDLGSDHNIIIATFSPNNIEYILPPKKINLYHKANWDKINKEITKNMEHHHIHNDSTCEEADKSIAHLTQTINNQIEIEVKIITIKPERIGLNKNIIDLIKQKRKYRRLHQKTGIMHYKQRYNQLTNQIKQIIKKANILKFIIPLVIVKILKGRGVKPARNSVPNHNE